MLMGDSLIRFSVIIPCWRRPELRECILANAAWLIRFAVDIHVVCTGPKDHLLTEDLKLLPADLRQLSSLLELEDDKFIKAKAINIGLRYAASHVVLLLDADVILHPDTIIQMWQAVSLGNCATVEKLQEMRPDRLPFFGSAIMELHADGGGVRSVRRQGKLTITWDDGLSTEVAMSTVDGVQMWRSGSGILMVDKNALLQIGGFDSSISGWGGEDLDVLLRLSRCLNMNRQEVGGGIHVSNAGTIAQREREPRSRSNMQNVARMIKKYSARNLLGTFSRDNLQSIPIFSRP